MSKKHHEVSGLGLIVCPDHDEGKSIAEAIAAADDALREAQITIMAARFLRWRLPADFNPDGGVSFKKPARSEWWPVGTNLLDAQQAEAMVRYLIEGGARLATVSDLLRTAARAKADATVNVTTPEDASR